MAIFWRRRSVRLQAFHYGQNAAYFVTICTAARLPIFGRIVDASFISAPLGEIVADEWRKSGPLRGVDLHEFVVMPNHVHGIVIFGDDRGAQPIARAGSRQPLRRHTLPLGNLIAGFKAAVTKRARRELDWDGPLCQRNYHEHVIRNEHDLMTIREYIVTNPAKWADDRYYA